MLEERLRAAGNAVALHAGRVQRGPGRCEVLGGRTLGLAYSRIGGALRNGVVSWDSSPGPDGRPRGLSRVIAFRDEPGGSPRRDWCSVIFRRV